MAVLLIAELSGSDLAVDATAKTLTAATALGEVTVLVAGSGCAGAAEQAATLDGVAKVLCADGDALGHGLAEPLAELVVSLAPGHSHIVAPATVQGKNLLPRVAALLDVMVITDIQEIVDADTFVRPIYAGNAIQTVKSADPVKVLSVRTANFDAAWHRRRRAGGGDRRARRSRPVLLGRGHGGRERPAGAHLGQDRRLRRARHGVEGEFRADREGRRQARRGDGREPGGGRFGLCAE